MVQPSKSRLGGTMASEREFKIKITGDASGVAVAAQKTGEALGQVSKETEKAGNAAKEASKQSEHHAEAHREMHKAMHLITEESPLMGAALRGSVTGLGAVL